MVMFITEYVLYILIFSNQMMFFSQKVCVFAVTLICKQIKHCLLNRLQLLKKEPPINPHSPLYNYSIGKLGG